MEREKELLSAEKHSSSVWTEILETAQKGIESTLIEKAEDRWTAQHDAWQAVQGKLFNQVGTPYTGELG